MKVFSKTLMAVSVMLAASGVSTVAMAGSTTMVTLTPQKIVGNNSGAGGSTAVALSKGGTQAAFTSFASNLTLQDGNPASDVFLRIGTSAFQKMSVNSLGQDARNSAANWYDGNNFSSSSNAAISSDGKLVVFQSDADNLDRLTLDTNNNTGSGTQGDVFLRDVSKKKTYRLSGIVDGADGSITPNLLDVDGNPVVSADAPWKVITEGNAQSANPAIAGTLKQAWVAFESQATNLAVSYSAPPITLTPFPTTASRSHIYVVDTKTKKIELIDATHDVSGNPLVEGNNNSSNAAISQDGRFVVFQSDASNLVAAPVTANNTDIFVYDRKLFTMYQISGVLGAVSPTGGYAVATEADNSSAVPSIAGDGKSKTKSYMIAFESRATNLDTIPVVDNGTDRDVFVVQFAATDTKNANAAYEIKSVLRVSSPIDAVTGLPTGEGTSQGSGTAANSRAPVIAGTDLAYTVAFRSTADNLLAVDPLLPYWNEDTNNLQDIYVYSSKTKTFQRANVDVTGEQGTATANNPAISPDGKAVGFDANDSYLTPDSLGAGTQVYLRKL
ncbi:MAG TPA: hypothetical protein VLB90_03935 [Pseudomonadales bacterium]|nr:hypothetical protein [Pseudomonadales bacterium]